jgi:hypothetical protein
VYYVGTLACYQGHHFLCALAHVPNAAYFHPQSGLNNELVATFPEARDDEQQDEQAVLYVGLVPGRSRDSHRRPLFCAMFLH